ncbi:hypothetical protein O181_000799 [Austropuccinia psidii MF-1]|uniref:Uncharacterized protein n=1 Tax=Austropuccinia psidii MF-1 TaxID=1389203 RepID=A0A9Q3B9A1_9BASI|nr:hypothetical protein [Austropuccinia psidii MF-1]
MSCTLCTKQGIPCIHSSPTTNACHALRQAHKKCLFVVKPFGPCRQRISRPRCPCEDSFVVNNDESLPKRECFWIMSPVPSSINFSTPPLLGHHPMVTSHFDQSKVIIQPMKDGNGIEQNPLNPPQQDSPVPCMPHKQTPGPSGTQWLEDLFCEPLQHHEPPIPGLSQSSESHEDTSTYEPEPEVAMMQSTKDPFACPTTPCSIIIIDDMHIGSLTPTSSPPIAPKNPTASLPQSHDEAWQEFTNLQLTVMIAQSTKSC